MTESADYVRTSPREDGLCNGRLLWVTEDTVVPADTMRFRLSQVS